MNPVIKLGPAFTLLGWKHIYNPITSTGINVNMSIVLAIIEASLFDFVFLGFMRDIRYPPSFFKIP